MKLIKELAEKYHISYPFIKFLFVGGINTLFAYSVFSFFIFVGFHYVLAAILSTIIGIMFNFKTTGSIVFKNKDNSVILKFFGVYAVTCSINLLFLKIFSYFTSNMYLANAILVLPIALLSFTLMRKFVFNKSFDVVKID